MIEIKINELPTVVIVQMIDAALDEYYKSLKADVDETQTEYITGKVHSLEALRKELVL